MKLPIDKTRALQILGVVGGTVGGVILWKFLTKRSKKPCDPLRTPPDSEPFKLKQVQVFFRHGARTPLHIIPGLEQARYFKEHVETNLPHTDIKHQVVFMPDGAVRQKNAASEDFFKLSTLRGGAGAGLLTHIGQQQMYKLGLRLREAYGDIPCFLPQIVNPCDVYIQTTNMDRTIASARCVAAGLFGKENLDHQSPLTMYALRGKDEYLYPNLKTCLLSKLVDREYHIKFDKIPGIREDRELFECMLGYDSCRKGMKLNLSYVKDDLSARLAFGYKLPEPLNSFVDMVEEDAIKIFYYSVCGGCEEERQLVTRVGIGKLVDKVITSMRTCVNGGKTPKLYLYSGHDATIVALLEVLGIFDNKWPPFAADITFELYQDAAGKHYVRVLYCGKQKIIRGCSKPTVMWEEFFRNIEPYRIKQEELQKLCQITDLKQFKECEECPQKQCKECRRDIPCEQAVPLCRKETPAIEPEVPLILEEEPPCIPPEEEEILPCEDEVPPPVPEIVPPPVPEEVPPCAEIIPQYPQEVTQNPPLQKEPPPCQ